MADTFTAHYNLTKPQIGGDPDTWGTLLNANFDTIDSQLYTASTYALPLTGGTLTGPLIINQTASQFALTIGSTGVNGAGFKLIGDGTTTPSKYIRVRTGVLEFVNDANSAIVTTMTDAGAWSFAQRPTFNGATPWDSANFTPGNYALLSGATFSGSATFNAGIGFGSTVAPGGNSDLSRHIALYSNSMGFGITGNRLNYVAPAGSSHVFILNGADVATISSAGFTVPGFGSFGAGLTSNNGQGAASAYASVGAAGGGFGTTVSMYPRLAAGSSNAMVPADAAGIVFSQQSQGAYPFFLGPWSAISGGVGLVMAGDGRTTLRTSGVTSTLALQDVGSNGANLALLGNGAVTPSKFIRAQAGKLEFVNSAYSAVVSSMDDTGHWSAADFSATSDERLKSDIRGLRRGLDELKRMLPREYVKDGREEIGFIAQEAREVIPEAVTEGDDGFLCLSYGQTLALVASAVLDLDARMALAGI